MQRWQGAPRGRQTVIFACVFGMALLAGGAYLLYLRYDVSPNTDVPWRTAGHFEKHAEVADNLFAVAPHAKTIVYSTTASGHGNLWTMGLDGQNNKQLTSHSEYESGPCYSPDGRQIAFSRETDKCGHIWIMNADGTGATQLTSGPDYDSNPIFTSDGQTIWFQRTPRGNSIGQYDLYTMTSAGKNIHLWKAPNSAVMLTVSFPSHASEVYVTRLTDDGRDPFQVWSMKPDGTDQHGLSDGRFPAVSPDSKLLAFVAGAGVNQLWTMQADGDQKRQVYDSDSKKFNVTFAPDGRSLFFLEKTTDGSFISNVKLDGSAYHRIQDVTPKNK